MVFKFTIDNFINPYVPKNNLEKSLPAPLRRFFGKHKTSPKDDYWIWLEILVASFAGIALLEGVFKSHTAFTSHHAPMIIASYGATAILCFNTVGAPLAQPRNILMGHFISSLIGICVQKLFLLSEGGRNNYWASGALSVGISSSVMSICNCVHPPAGASALLPSIDEAIQEMSWWYLPMQLVSSVLIICVAMITGNVIRSYPAYWWTAAPLGKPETVVEPEKEPETSIDEEARISFEGVTEVNGIDLIEISKTGILVPSGLDLTELEVEWLDTIQSKLKQ